MNLFPRRPNTLRLPGIDYSSGGAYFLTICTQEKQQIFTDKSIRKLALNAVKQVSAWAGILLVAACCLPDHIHLLILLNQQSKKSVSSLVRNFKAKFYQDYRKSTGEKKSPWQRNYYDHIIRNDLDFNEKLQYIVENPMKANLTQQECDPEYVFLNLSALNYDNPA